MRDTEHRAVAIVGIGSVLPDAPDIRTFWSNVKAGRYSISEIDPDRWDPALYYDPDPAAPDRTYSKIGGWIREWDWNPLGWRLPIPPKVADAMDGTQRWAISCARAALADYGAPDRKLDPDRTAVILGNAMGGEKHYMTALRIAFPEFARDLERSPSFGTLPEEIRGKIVHETGLRFREHTPDITEDSMPGELANCIAGRIANLFNFHGPNYVVDAACASAMAAITAAVEGLKERDFDTVLTGGIDRNMGASTFIKFSKIGALSATGTRPYAAGADGFVMGEGAVVMLLKRLSDAERDGDHVYAVIRGLGGSSDGRGKGITAPNPVGQKLSVKRAWDNAGISPETASLIEGHGTSTRVGDVVEVQSLTEVFQGAGARPSSIPIGSVKSNIGHLKAAAGAAGLLKTVMALHDKVLPPSLNCDEPNPNIDFSHSPFYVNSELRDWETPPCGVRRAGVSAFGFGGTNFHTVLEEFVPGRLGGAGRRMVSVGAIPQGNASTGGVTAKAPLRGALVLGASSTHDLKERLRAVLSDAEASRPPAGGAPLRRDLEAAKRIAIDYAHPGDLANKCQLALRALDTERRGTWKALNAKGVFRGGGDPAKIAFLYTGQGSQYVNMLATLRREEPIVRETFDEADRVMSPLLDGGPLTDLIFVDPDEEAAVAHATRSLMQTAITQPAVLAVDIALTRLLAAFGIVPDMVMGHSLGEYGALVASGAMSFADALEAVSARGREMTAVSVGDAGKMAAVFAPLDDLRRILARVDGYVVIANINSNLQAVIGGASPAVDDALVRLSEAGVRAVPLPVSHAFHTSIVAPASEPLRAALHRLALQGRHRPVVSNVSGEFYPEGPDAVPGMIDLLARQVASPVQFVKGLETLYAAGARVFVEIGPKKALKGFVDDVLGDRGDVASLFTNHPRVGDVASLNMALAGLYAAGHGQTAHEEPQAVSVPTRNTPTRPVVAPTPTAPTPKAASTAPANAAHGDRGRFEEMGRLFAEFLDRGMQIYGGDSAPEAVAATRTVVTGAALGLPGTPRIFDEENVARLLRGDQFIDVIPFRVRESMADKHITRLVKRADGEATFETIDRPEEVIKLAGRGGEFDPVGEFGISKDRAPALDTTTAMAIAAGIDALRDAGIPLVLRYKTTSTGTQLPDRWQLPESLRDDTGVIFASAFPGYDAFAGDLTSYNVEVGRREHLANLRSLRETIAGAAEVAPDVLGEFDRRIADLERTMANEAFSFDRRFLFRVLAMGHSQFAEEIGARGPNTQINAACASTTQAMSLAEDWIRLGRCRRAIVVSADNVTSDHLLEWIGAGFLASGAAATDDDVTQAALPFDRRRHGMLVGMGAAALVVESEDAASERGIRPICELLGAVCANSAFHGTRLDVAHISGIMEQLVSHAERRHGVCREEMAGRTVFVSHETYTPARGGSAAAEVHALREVYGSGADKIVIANTKGFTGHPMGVGIEDVLAVKSLETGIVPPVPNFKEIDPELGTLNLSRGGSYPVEFALRLAAGFGSQVSMSLMRWVPSPDGRHQPPDRLGHGYRVADPPAYERWLADVSGDANAELEVVQHRLRVKDRRMPRAADARTRPETATSAAVTSQPSAPTPVPHADETRERVLEIVTATTGYPPDMLDMDLDLEADLGIDTVKQAEVFAAIREAYGIPRDDQLKLRDFPTLEHVVRFAKECRPDRAPATPAPVPAANGPGTDPIQARILEIVAATTGYPADMLDLDLDLEADLGIDTVKQAEVFASIREAYDIPREESLQLRDFPTLHHVVGFARERMPAAASSTPSLPVTPAATTASQPGDFRTRILDIVADTTGYPADMLDPDLDLEADLGIDTVKQAEIFASVREAYDIPRDENLQLRDFPTLASVIQFARDRSATDVTVADATQSTSPETPLEATAGADPVVERLLGVVETATGYPRDMLELDLDLEADLGIDTVKQAEIVASIRESYGIPRDDNLQLRDFPTLTHVVRFVKDRMPEAAGASPAVPAAPRADASNDVRVDAPQGDIEATRRLPRRVPVPAWRPPLELCKPTGVELDGRRVVIMPDRRGIAKALTDRLRKRGAEPLILDPNLGVEALCAQLDSWKATGPIQGVFWLPALDSAGRVDALSSDEWRDALHLRVKLLYATMRRLYDDIASPGRFLIAATRLGGKHGYDGPGAHDPLGGAVCGFVKAFKRERRDVLCKVVDFDVSRRTAEPADRLLDEALRDPGAVEIGIQDGERWTVGLDTMPTSGHQRSVELGPNSVFVVTGAAGSIVSAIIGDLAGASGGTFHLLDLTPRPDAADTDLGRLSTDRDGLKRDIFERIKADGRRATPALVEKTLAGLERSQAALAAIQAVERAGGTAHYHAVDLTDADAVAVVMDRIRETHGHVDVLMHAAGLEISHELPGKPSNEFDLVFDVKADGWHNMLHALGDTPIGAAVAFSSVAGRFGNSGQTDYSAANDLLCKCISNLRTTRPGTVGLAIDWTAWGGIGMATRGSIPKMMELAGIDMLAPEAGIPVVRRELSEGPAGAEIIVAERLGMLVAEWDPSGGIDPSLLPEPSGPMIGRVVCMGVHDGLTIETELDPTEQPFLDHHRIDGVPVLPGVMSIEAMAEMATIVLPGWHVGSIEDVSFLAPFKFYRDESRSLRLTARFTSENGFMIAECRLIGVRRLAGGAEPQITTHVTARVRLVPDPPVPIEAEPPVESAGAIVESGQVYEIYFHGPAYRVLDQAWTGGPATVVGRMAGGLPAGHRPGDRKMRMAPRHVELCFQAAGMFELGKAGRMGLPAHVGRVTKFRDPATAVEPLYSVVRRRDGEDGFDAKVVDGAGQVYMSLEDYRTIERPDVPDPRLLAPIRAAIEGTDE